MLFLLSGNACGGGSDETRGSGVELGDVARQFLRWNSIAIDASGLDHARQEGAEQLGPTKSSRAMAMSHLSLFETINAFEPRYRSALGLDFRPLPDASIQAAITQSAHDTLSALYPSQASIFTQALREDFAGIENTEALQTGAEFGAAVAAAVLLSREGDGSELSTNFNETLYTFSELPGRWRRDPINPEQIPLGSLWHQVRPFTLTESKQFRAPPPPSLQSTAYAEAFAETFRLGGDGINTPTERTADQTEIGIFWAYDGLPNLCAPPRLYNQLTREIALSQGTADPLELSRLFALVNIALADAAIAVWDSKYFYDFWRPVTGIREADEGTGPSGLGDENPLTFGDTSFTPLGSPSSNTFERDFTPPFPSYPSGHAGLGSAVFNVLRLFYGSDQISFSFVSDEFNGITTDSAGNVRPLIQRSYQSLSQAEQENAFSRVFLGIHWRFDSTEGITQGRSVGEHVYQTILTPLGE